MPLSLIRSQATSVGNCRGRGLGWTFGSAATSGGEPGRARSPRYLSLKADEDDARGDDDGRDDSAPSEGLPERGDANEGREDDTGLPDSRDLGERGAGLGPQHDAVRGRAQKPGH